MQVNETMISGGILYLKNVDKESPDVPSACLLRPGNRAERLKTALWAVLAKEPAL
jgi:hypothetical protein